MAEAVAVEVVGVAVEKDAVVAENEGTFEWKKN